MAAWEQICKKLWTMNSWKSLTLNVLHFSVEIVNLTFLVSHSSVTDVSKTTTHLEIAWLCYAARKQKHTKPPTQISREWLVTALKSTYSDTQKVCCSRFLKQQIRFIYIWRNALRIFSWRLNDIKLLDLISCRCNTECRSSKKLHMFLFILKKYLSWTLR